MHIPCRQLLDSSGFAIMHTRATWPFCDKLQRKLVHGVPRDAISGGYHWQAAISSIPMQIIMVPCIFGLQHRLSVSEELHP